MNICVHTDNFYEGKPGQIMWNKKYVDIKYIQKLTRQ